MRYLPPLHRVMQTLRARYGVLQFQCAAALGVGPSQLSHIEYGRQRVPTDFVAKISDALKLFDDDRQMLDRAVECTRFSAKIETTDPRKREKVAVLCSAVAHWSQEELDNLLSRLKIEAIPLSRGTSKNSATQLAAPLAFRQVLDKATELRRRAGLIDGQKMNFMEFFEHTLDDVVEDFDFQMIEKELMPRCYSVTIPDLKHILIREDIYNYAAKGGTGSQQILAHEVGHLILHECISTAPQTNAQNYPRYYHAEWQADKFAQCFLIPPSEIRKGESSASLAKRLGVSEHVAEYQIHDCAKRGLI